MDFWQVISFTETDQLIQIAKIAEEVGFGGLCFSEHLVTPETITSRYPYTEDGKIWWDPEAHWPEPWAMASVLASHTTRLRFVPVVYVLPMHDLFSAAKAVSTAAYLSDNRVILGVGVGWLEDEFRLTGQDFSNRGPRTDEMLEVMQRLFAGGMVEHHGRFYDFPAVQMSPAPTRPVPVYVGGGSDAALRRAARHDGWIAGGPIAVEALLEQLTRLGEFRRREGDADRPFDVLASLGGEPTVDEYKRLRDAGVTGIMRTPWYFMGEKTSTIESKRASLERFALEVIEPLQ